MEATRQPGIGRIIGEMPGLTFVILVIAIGLLVLIPTRRLFVGGWTSGPLTIYFVGMVLLGLLVAEVRGPARYLVPILVLAYIGPFITVRQGLDRIRGRLGGGSATPPNVDRGAGADPPNVHDAGSGWTRGFRSPPRSRQDPRPRPAPGRRRAPRNVTPPEARPPETTG
jgi:hypothetical protein